MTESTKRDFSLDDAFPERWLHADDLRDEDGHLRDVTLTITDVYKEQLRIPGSRPSDAYVVSFLKTKREYVLNKTNARFLKARFGKMSGDAIGHKVTLHPVADESGKSNSGYRILFVDPPSASVDPATGEVTDAAEAAPATQTAQNGDPGAEAAADAFIGVDDPDGDADENEDIPGRGVLFDTGDPDRPATGPDKKQLTEALAHVPTPWAKDYCKRFGGRSNS